MGQVLIEGQSIQHWSVADSASRDSGKWCPEKAVETLEDNLMVQDNSQDVPCWVVSLVVQQVQEWPLLQYLTGYNHAAKLQVQ